MRQGNIGKEPEYRRKQQEVNDRQRHARQQERVIRTIVSIRAGIDGITAEHAANRQQASALERGKRKRELYTFWALVVAAGAAIVTLILSHCDNRAIIGESQRVAAQQHGDTLAVLTEVRKQTRAAIAQVQTAQIGLTANTRPWIEPLELKVNGISLVMTQSRKAIMASVIFSYRNIGHSPARMTWVDARILTDPLAEFNYQVRGSVCGDKFAGDLVPWGATLFPGATSTAAPFNNEPTKVNVWAGSVPEMPKNGHQAIGIIAAVCISYTFDGARHGTSIVYRISTQMHCLTPPRNCGNMFEIDKSYFPANEIVVTPIESTIRAN
jgi:hypothetical protein